MAHPVAQDTNTTRGSITDSQAVQGSKRTVVAVCWHPGSHRTGVQLGAVAPHGIGLCDFTHSDLRNVCPRGRKMSAHRPLPSRQIPDLVGSKQLGPLRICHLNRSNVVL